MTELQRSLLRASEIRTRLSELGGEAELSDEQRGELDTLRGEYGTVERKCQALAIGEDQPVVEERSADKKRRELEANANLGEIVTAAVENRQTEGATSELQKELGLSANQIPLALLREPEPEVEERAVTPAPADVGAMQAQIIPGVFPMSCGAFLGVDMPSVGVGEAVFPVLTKNATVHTPAENAEATETTGAFSAEVLSPVRLQASFFYSREDRARFAGMAEALRMNLSEALSDGLDKAILAGTDGLLEGTNLPNHNVNAVTTYADYRDHFLAGRVDGKYASGVGDLRIVMGSGTYVHADAVWRGTNTSNDVSALDVLMARSGGVKVSAHVPAVASSKQNAVIRLGMRRDMVAPIWEGVTLIPDEVTKASHGQIVLTAVLLHAVKIVRSAGFYKQQSQHA